MFLIRRAIAAVIDIALFLGLSSLFWDHQQFAAPDETGNYGSAGCLLFLLNGLCYFLYFGILESTVGYTLGKMIVGLKVETLSGRHPSIVQSIQRHLLDIIEFQIFGIPALVAAKLNRGRRLGDLWGETVIVNDGD